MRKIALILAIVLALAGIASAPVRAQDSEVDRLVNAYADGIRYALDQSWFARSAKPTDLYRDSTGMLASKLGINPPQFTGDSRKDFGIALTFVRGILERVTDAKDREAIFTVALYGLLASRDQYMAVFDPDYLALMLGTLGFFDAGDGLLTSSATDADLVDEVVTGMGGDKAGIKVGDEIIEVNGIPIRDITDAMAYRIERQARKTGFINYTVKRGTKTFKVDVEYRVRARPKVESRMLNATTGYIMIPAYDLGIGSEFVDAMESLVSNGATSIVLDLRKNPGGLAWEEQIVVSVFKQGALYIRRYKKGADIVSSVGVDKPFTGPLAVLVDKNSASAAEVTTFALRGRPKTRIFGENSDRTYGKGVGQQAFRLSNGWFFYFTVTELAGLDGVSYNGLGVTVDEVVNTSGSASAEDETVNRALVWLSTQK